MNLPILQSSAIPPASADLVRYAHKLLRELASETAGTESEDLDAGTALHNVSLRDVPLLNAIVDAAVPQGDVAESVIDRADDYFRAKGVACLRWVPNPSSTPESQRNLTTVLTARGFVERSRPIFHAGLDVLGVPPAHGEAEKAAFMIVPARAAYAQAAALAARLAASASHAAADLGGLDDPRLDASLAMRSGEAVGRVGVLAVGETGLLVGPEVVDLADEDAAIADVLLDRALNYCLRAQLRHVFAFGDENADRLTARGFRVVGDYVEFFAGPG